MLNTRASAKRRFQPSRVDSKSTTPNCLRNDPSIHISDHNEKWLGELRGETKLNMEICTGNDVRKFEFNLKHYELKMSNLSEIENTYVLHADLSDVGKSYKNTLGLEGFSRENYLAIVDATQIALKKWLLTKPFGGETKMGMIQSHFPVFQMIATTN